MRLSTILFCIGVLFTVTACFDDKGNYNYTTVNIPEIDTTGGFPLTYNVEQFKNLVVEPNITFTGNSEDLSYQWLLYVKTTQSNAPPSAVVSTEKVFDRIMGETPGYYVLELVVTDTKTGITDNLQFDVVVEASVESGWMVLHTKDGVSDVDFIVTKNAVPAASTGKWLKNLYATANGAPIPGEGRNVSQVRYATYYLNYLNIGTSSDFVRASGTDLTKVNDHTTIFKRGSMSVNSQAQAYYGYFEAYISDNKLYMINYALEAIKSPATVAYFSPVPYDYKLAPFMPDLTSTANTYSSSSSQGGVFYDVENLRFVKVPFAFSAFRITPFIAQTGPFDVNNIGKELVYLERAYQNYTYAFFKDESGNGRWLYVADFSSTDAGTVAKGAYDMTGLPAIDQAKFYQCGDLGYVAYYATDNAIYTYDYYGANTASIAYNSFAAGEVITSMKIYKPKSFNDLSAVNNRILYVATWSESTQTSKLYEFAIDPTSGAITQAPLNVFEDFGGKIVDMCRKVKG